MSDLNNPLFDNQREFLERQKEEYKNALMGDVDQIKSQGQEIGKKAAIAGGVLLAGYLVKRMFSSGKKKLKKHKKDSSKKDLNESVYATSTGGTFNDYDSYVHEQEDNYTISSERMPHAVHEETYTETEKKEKSFLKSGIGKVLTTQVVTLLLVYAGKMAEEYINTVSENNDIAEEPIVVTEIETTEYIIPEKDAL